MNNAKSNLNGKTVFITGATSGIGKVAAIDLALRGATVVATYRDLTKAEQLLDGFNNQKNSDTKGSIDLIYCDLSSIASINDACKSLRLKYQTLDILINNAGVWNWSFIESKDGFEEIFAVNVLAPILITNNLFNIMPSVDSKIVFTSSGLHGGEINFDDIEYKKSYNGYKSYQQSKLCNIIIGRFFSSILSKKGISAYSFHPGFVSTDLGRGSNPIARFAFTTFGKTPEKGAETLIYLATEDKENLKSGEYYVNKKIAKTQEYSYDDEIAKKLIKTVLSYFNKANNPEILISTELKNL